MPFPEVFDSSIVNDLKECPAKFDMAHVWDYKPRGMNVHLHAGGSFAIGCEATRRAFYLGEYKKWIPPRQEVKTLDGQAALVETPGQWLDKPGPTGDREAAISCGVEALMSAYGEYEAPDYGSGSSKTLDRMAGALIFYWDNFPLNHNNAFPIALPGGKRGIEFSFTEVLPIDHPDTGNPLLYTGRLDAVLNFAGGHWGFDEKTTTSLGSTWGGKWGLRGQFLGYTWGCRQAGIPIKGIVVRGVSILKTKYEVAESINEFADWQLDLWYTELLEWIEDAKVAYVRKRFRHNFGEACSNFGGCQFKDACSSKQPHKWLETQFERRHWDPVTRKETVL